MTSHVERLRDVIARDLGLTCEDDGKRALLADLLVGREPIAYLDRLEAGAPDELRRIAAALTVGESYFFRHAEQFRALVELALPDRGAVRASSRRLRLLSAGCSSGEEPYSLAMLTRGLVDAGWQIAIRAIDVNPEALARAAAARYSAWALRETPDDARLRWFRHDGASFVLDASIRAAVQLEEGSLAVDDADLWAPAGYDVIFCRNVMMYFTLGQQQALVDRLSRALAPGGYLFLGHAETLRGLSQAYHLRHTHGAFYYQRKDGPDPVVAASPARRAEPPASTTPTAGWESTWLETIQGAADRIRALSEAAAARPTAAAPAATSDELGPTLELLRRERFAEALVDLDRLGPARARDPDVQLLRAALLAHSGRLDEAERACGALLERDELSSGAHYLLALCREGRGDPRGATEHDQLATYLDPTFAMPRLHLGLLARRTGDRDGARRELAQAAALLHLEDASRLLLFGGGFTREALIAMCGDAGAAR